MPPTTWAETASLLTTYALFLNMLFGKRNQHLQGLNDVRRQFIALSEIQDTLDELYYANLIWAIIDAMYRHFNEPLVMTDFESSAGMGGVIWPLTGLKLLACTLGMHQQLNLLTFPHEWIDALECKLSHQY